MDISTLLWKIYPFYLNIKLTDSGAADDVLFRQGNDRTTGGLPGFPRRNGHWSLRLHCTYLPYGSVWFLGLRRMADRHP